MPTATADLLESLNARSPEVKALLDLREQIFSDLQLKRQADEALANWNGTAERQGVLAYLLGRTERALNILEAQAKGDFGKHFLARAYLDAGHFAKAESLLAGQFESARGLEYGIPLFRSQLALNKLKEAEKTLSSMKADATSADVRAARAHLAMNRGDLDQAAVEIEQLVRENPENRYALFVLALVASAACEDDTVRSAYERLAQRPPVSTDVLINLGTIYEDEGEFDLAVKCYEQVMKDYPSHKRARLFKRDAEASMNMFYDEDRERREDKRLQILRTPVTDFELSVRSRNCLSKMKIETLGDLILKTESELLSYKNFGETSLQEIKSILASKGLRLGMRKEEALSYIPPEDKGGKPVQGDDVLARPIESLAFSVRSKRCMDRLGIAIVADLTAKTEAELLGTPNFGQTSLNEVKQKLAELGLSLSA
jgi:DNA-directed RNA polymerase subunit alpha